MGADVLEQIERRPLCFPAFAFDLRDGVGQGNAAGPSPLAFKPGARPAFGKVGPVARAFFAEAAFGSALQIRDKTNSQSRAIMYSERKRL
jgi:hypothetical protein